jgi:hypothetical protein
MSFTHFIKSLCNSSLAAMLALTLAFAAFLALEPTVGRSATDTFTVTQVVTDETAFIVATNDVSMSPNLAGVTGGTASGSTTVRVRTNNSTGYNMTIAFSTSTAMRQNGGSGVINNYNPASTTRADFAFTPEVFSQFSYTVVASTSGDLPTYFRDNASICGAGAANTASTCWSNPSTTARQVILTSAATQTSGSTSTIAFRVNIPSNPIPAVPEGTYVATATLTAINN